MFILTGAIDLIQRVSIVINIWTKSRWGVFAGALTNGALSSVVDLKIYQFYSQWWGWKDNMLFLWVTVLIDPKDICEKIRFCDTRSATTFWWWLWGVLTVEDTSRTRPRQKQQASRITPRTQTASRDLVFRQTLQWKCNSNCTVLKRNLQRLSPCHPQDSFCFKLISSLSGFKGSWH